MQDPLNAIRRLYGEPGAEDVAEAPDARAEAETFAALKAGLDALPPQRPDAATLDAVFAAAAVPVTASDDVLAPLNAVYGEAAGSVDSPEAAAIAALKAGLDALPPQRPDAATLDAVFAAASAATGSVPAETRPARAADRAPQRLVTRRRAVVALGAAFALMIVLTSGLWLGTPNDLQTVASTEEQTADADVPEAIEEESAFEVDAENLIAEAAPVTSQPTPRDAASSGALALSGRRAEPEVQARAAARPSRAEESLARTSAPPPPAEVSSPVAADVAVAKPEFETTASFAAGNLAGQGVGDLALASDELPLADGEEAIQTLYLRMREMQAAQAGLGWDEPPVALGGAPDSVPVQSGWMQVRVDR